MKEFTNLQVKNVCNGFCVKSFLCDKHYKKQHNALKYLILIEPLGHLLLLGASGAGKTVLSRFVAWMNSMKTFQIKVHRGYTADDFDTDLRAVLIRSGVEREKIAFIFDESNVLDTAFLERMNALLASGEVPGLFEVIFDILIFFSNGYSVRKEGFYQERAQKNSL